MNTKLKNIINMICFIGVFIIMFGIISSSEDLLDRIVPSILFIWSAENVVMIIKKLFGKNNKPNLL